MSYRDLRNFTEIMRALGYPRLISMENFRNPNFPLVAEVLTWLISRYDPTADLPTDVDTQQDRVIFIKSTAQFIATKANIRLNTKKLYGADGYAVKELLKIASMLYSAMRTNKAETESQTTHFTPSFAELSNKSTELKTCRQLSSQITAKGAKLYQLLGKEVDLRELRRSAISRAVDVDEIEKGVKQSIAAVESDIHQVTQMLDNCASDEANLSVKIERKRQDLERNQKRLRSLANVRPAFMEEYEKLEVELQKQYESYMEKFRNLSFLEHQLEEHQRAEQDKLEETETNLKRMQLRMQEAEKRMIQDDVTTDGMLAVVTDEFPNPKEHRVIGSMTADGIESDDEDTGSLTSGTDRDAEGGLEGMEEEEEDGELLNEDDNSDDF